MEKSDLAVADSSGISILLQNPNMPGTFLPRTALGIGSWASSVAIADINGDNKADLIATPAASVVVLLQNPAVPGTLSPPTNYGVGLQPIYAAVSDLNGDGKPDLAVANLGSPSDGNTSSVSVLLQSPDASGAFLSQTACPKKLPRCTSLTHTGGRSVLAAKSSCQGTTLRPRIWSDCE